MGLFNRLKTVSKCKLITTDEGGYFQWDGKIYDSDIIRSVIRPQIEAVGKLNLKHIYETTDENGEKNISINPQPYLRFLLMRPNPYMSMQQFLKKMQTWVELNNNAFALIIRDENGYATEIYPINAVSADALTNNTGELFIRFVLTTGKMYTFPYSELIHFRGDYNRDDIFGESNWYALKPLMEIISTTDQGIVKAIKNSSIIRWLLQYQSVSNPEKLKKAAKEFSKSYLDTESEGFGVAAVDGSVKADQVKPESYVPNAAQMNVSIDRIYSFFNTNQKIVQSSYNEDEWNSFYESKIEPRALDIQNEFTWKIFSRREIACGNYIYAEASNLDCASLTTKLAFVSMVDRGAMTPNEWREFLKLSPLPGGNKPLRRLDTVTVNEGGETNED